MKRRESHISFVMFDRFALLHGGHQVQEDSDFELGLGESNLVTIVDL